MRRSRTLLGTVAIAWSGRCTTGGKRKRLGPPSKRRPTLSLQFRQISVNDRPRIQKNTRVIRHGSRAKRPNLRFEEIEPLASEFIDEIDQVVSSIWTIRR